MSLSTSKKTIVGISALYFCASSVFLIWSYALHSLFHVWPSLLLALGCVTFCIGILTVFSSKILLPYTLGVITSLTLLISGWSSVFPSKSIFSLSFILFSSACLLLFYLPVYFQNISTETGADSEKLKQSLFGLPNFTLPNRANTGKKKIGNK